MTNADNTQAQNKTIEVGPEDQHETGEEVHYTLTDNNVDEYGLDGPHYVARFVSGVNQELDAEVVLAADARGSGADDPLVYLSLHEMVDNRSAAVYAEFEDDQSAYVGAIEDVAEAVAELLERDDVWVVRGDEDSLDAIKSYQ